MTVSEPGRRGSGSDERAAFAPFRPRRGRVVATVSALVTLLVFAVLQAITLGCFGLSTSNFSAMAMENMGHIAGTASSVQGFASVTFGASIGAAIGQAFDGSTAPLTGGFLLMGIAALLCVLVTERGRLFQPIHPDQA